MSDPRENPFPSRLIGHAPQQARFQKTLAGRAQPHAWLLTGRKGIGKRSFALLAAAKLFGVTRTDPEKLAFARDDPHFKLMLSGAHPDLLWVQRAVDPKTGKQKTEISVEQVRTMKASLYLTPGRASCRVAIIDSVDEMNRNSANALLKLLEEPPRGVHLFLVCHNPSATLATIRSRCASLPFSGLSTAEMHDWRDMQRELDPEPAGSEEDWQAALQSACPDDGRNGVPGLAYALLKHGVLPLEQALTAYLDAGQRAGLAAARALAGEIAKSDREAKALLKTRVFDRIHRTARRNALDPQATDQAPPARVPAGHVFPDKESGSPNNGFGTSSLVEASELWDKTQDRFGSAEALNLDERGLWTSVLLGLKR